jgi:hypothetical protein
MSAWEGNLGDAGRVHGIEMSSLLVGARHYCNSVGRRQARAWDGVSSGSVIANFIRHRVTHVRRCPVVCMSVRQPHDFAIVFRSNVAWRPPAPSY